MNTNYINFLDRDLIKGLIPRRESNSHKDDFGRLLVIAGSYMYPGAAILSSRAAYRVGTGVYSYLPLGKLVLDKIENLVREEMLKISNEINMPSLASKELWSTTGRIDSVDVLMKTIGANAKSYERNNVEYILNPTHEEVITPLAKEYIVSYKHFPFALFQIQTKFRNEARAKSGLLRGREFRMKDLYSFHTSIEDLKEYYEKVKKSYFIIFEKLGLFLLVLA